MSDNWWEDWKDDPVSPWGRTIPDIPLDEQGNPIDFIGDEAELGAEVKIYEPSVRVSDNPTLLYQLYGYAALSESPATYLPEQVFAQWGDIYLQRWWNTIPEDDRPRITAGPDALTLYNLGIGPNGLTLGDTLAHEAAGFYYSLPKRIVIDGNLKENSPFGFIDKGPANVGKAVHMAGMASGWYGSATVGPTQPVGNTTQARVTPAEQRGAAAAVRQQPARVRNAVTARGGPGLLREDVERMTAPSTMGLPTYTSDELAAMGAAAARNRFGGNGSSGPRWAIDKRALMERGKDLWRARLREEPSEADLTAYVDQFEGDARRMFFAGGTLDYDAYLLEKLRTRDRWKYIYAGKPAGTDEGDYLAQFDAAAQRVGVSMKNLNREVALAGNQGQSGTGFQVRVSREADTRDVNEGSFVGALSRTIADSMIGSTTYRGSE